MWVYGQAAGELLYHDGEAETHVAYGYSGREQGKNNPEAQQEKGVGPIPRGLYTIGAAHDSATHGPCVLPLAPHPDNLMFERSGFLMHGDSREHPGLASEGCIIMARNIRERVAVSGDNQLVVVAHTEGKL